MCKRLNKIESVSRVSVCAIIIVYVCVFFVSSYILIMACRCAEINYYSLMTSYITLFVSAVHYETTLIP